MSRGVDGRSYISNLYLSLSLPTCYLNDTTYLPTYHFELFFFLFFFPDRLLLRLSKKKGKTTIQQQQAAPSST